MVSCLFYLIVSYKVNLYVDQSCNVGDIVTLISRSGIDYPNSVIININWKRNTVENLLKKLNKAIIIFVFLIGVILFLLEGPIIFFIGIILSIWLFISIINDFYEKIRTKKTIF